MPSEWITNLASAPEPAIAVVDAYGSHVGGVVRARETEDGVEAVALAADGQGNEIFGSTDGVEFAPVEAHMYIPGGMLIELEE